MCPICRGEGKIKFGQLYSKKKEWLEIKNDMCITLKKDGYTYREIAHLLGYKSTRSVWLIVNKRKAEMLDWELSLE